MSMNYDPVTVQYTIQSGDTLWDIADDYNIDINEIMAANPGVDLNTLYVGQVLSIPDDPSLVYEEQFRRGFRRPFREFRRPFFRRRFFREPFEEEPFFGFAGPFWWF